MIKKKIFVTATLLILTLMLPLTVYVEQQFYQNRTTAKEPQTTLTPSEKINAKISNNISGYVYIDINRNGERDLDERGFPFAQVLLRYNMKNSPATSPTEKENIQELENYDKTAPLNPTLPDNEARLSQITNADQFGYFKFSLISEKNRPVYEYKVQLIVPLGYQTSTRNPINIQKLNPNAFRLVEFGIYQQKVEPTGRITPTLSCRPRPNCLDMQPPCRLPEPIEGWCPTKPSTTPRPTYYITRMPTVPICPTPRTCRPGEKLQMAENRTQSDEYLPVCPEYICVTE